MSSVALTCASQFAWKDSMLPEFDKFALFGPEEVLARCEASATIPQPGPAESLNVAAAGAIALYELSRGAS